MTEFKKCCDNPKIKNSTGCPSCWTCENCNGYGCSNMAAYFPNNLPTSIKIEFPSDIETCKPIVPDREFLMKKKDRFVYVYCDNDNDVVEIFNKFEDAKKQVIESWGEYEDEPIVEEEPDRRGLVCQCHDYVCIYKKKLK